jgi:hypothetical protein
MPGSGAYVLAVLAKAILKTKDALITGETRRATQRLPQTKPTAMYSSLAR